MARVRRRVVEHGFHAVAALPTRLRNQRMGGLNLFLAEPGSLPDASIILRQALADVSTIGILRRVLSRAKT